MSNPYRPQSAEILNDVWDGPNDCIRVSSSQLGTPGTGEPAHAGGSTGLIGWLRDILAKIAAVGTSAAPSADVLSVQSPVRRIVHRSEPIPINTEFYGDVIAVNPSSTTLRVMCQTNNDSSIDGLAVLYYMSESDIVLDPPGDGNYWQYLPIVPVVAGSASPTGFVQVGQAEICIPLYAPFYQIYFKSGSTYAGHLYIVSLEY